MIVNREKLSEELRAAGVAIKGFNADGPQAGRAVLADGTIVGHDGALSHEAGATPNAAGAALYRSTLLAHDPALTPAQDAADVQRRMSAATRDGRIMAALVMVTWPNSTAAERAWAAAVIAGAGERVREARA